MSILDAVELTSTWAFRIGLVALGIGLVGWLAAVFLKVVLPAPGVAIPAVEVVGEKRGSGHGQMLTHLLDAELRRIRDDFTTAIQVLQTNLKKWEEDLEKELRQISAQTTKTPTRTGASPFEVASAQVAAPPTMGLLDPETIQTELEHLRVFAETLGSTTPPEIRVSGVDFGPVLQWLANRILPKSPHSLMLVDDGPRAVILASGPIFGGPTIALDLGPSEPALPPQEIVDPIAYHVLAATLRNRQPTPIDLGGWEAIRLFVLGLTGFARDADTPAPSTAAALQERSRRRAEIIENLLHAADKMRLVSPASARDIVSFAAFFTGQIEDYGRAIEILESHTALFADADSAKTRQWRVEVLRKHDITRAVEAAVRSRRPGDGAGITAAAVKLATQPVIKAAFARHRLGRDSGNMGRVQPVRVTIVGATPPGWLGLGTAAPILRSDEGHITNYVGELAQILRTLTPHASFSFISIEDRQAHSTSVINTVDLVNGIATAVAGDADIVIIPFGPLRPEMIDALTELGESEKVVIFPAGNNPAESHRLEVPENLVDHVLFAASIRANGSLSDFSATPKGALAVLGEDLPVAVVQDDGIGIERRAGTGPATAVLAAVVVETKLQFPNLSIPEVSRTLRATGRKTQQSKMPIAVVP